MSFTKVQFIGHAIHTGPRWDGYTFSYVGHDVEAEDAKARLELVKKVLDIAHKAASADAGTLKVFVLPEFFFRGKLGAYHFDNLAALFGGLQGLVKDSAFASWSFVFGTALAWTLPAFLSTIKLPPPAPYSIIDLPLEIFNIALCQQGGKGPEGANIIEKWLKSGIDFVRLRWLPNSLPSPLGFQGLVDELVRHANAPLDPSEPRPSEKSEHDYATYSGKCVFNGTGGLTFGVEICLDHLVGRLKESAQLPKINVQIVTSCGAALKAESLVVTDGWAFNVDGLNKSGNSNAKGDAHTQLLAFKAGKSGNVPALRPVDLDRSIGDVADLFASGPGQLHLYDPAPLNP